MNTFIIDQKKIGVGLVKILGHDLFPGQFSIDAYHPFRCYEDIYCIFFYFFLDRWAQHLCLLILSLTLFISPLDPSHLTLSHLISNTLKDTHTRTHTLRQHPPLFFVSSLLPLCLFLSLFFGILQLCCTLRHLGGEQIKLK